MSLKVRESHLQPISFRRPSDVAVESKRPADSLGSLADEVHPARQNEAQRAMRGLSKTQLRLESAMPSCPDLSSLCHRNPLPLGLLCAVQDCDRFAFLAMQPLSVLYAQDWLLSMIHVQRLLSRDALKLYRHKMWLKRPADPEHDNRAATVINRIWASSEIAQAARCAERAEPKKEFFLNRFPYCPSSFPLTRNAALRHSAERPRIAHAAREPAQFEQEYRHGTLTLLAMISVHTGFIDRIL